MRPRYWLLTLLCVVVTWPTGCSLFPAGFLNLPVSSGAPDLAGIWAIGDGTGFFGLFTIDASGNLSEMCRQVDLEENNITQVFLDGLPHELQAGVVIIARGTVLLNGQDVMIDLEWQIQSGGALLAGAKGTFGGRRTSADEGKGFFVVYYDKLGEEAVQFFNDVVVKRISEVPGTCMVDDSFEPNDSAGAAAGLASGSYPDLRCFNEDWYRVEVPAGQLVRAFVRFDAALGDLAPKVYDRDGYALLATSTSMSDGRMVIFPQEPGSYLLRVNGTMNPQYDIEIVSLVDDGFEDNDAEESAAIISPGEYDLVGFDDDLFYVAISDTQRVSVTITFNESEVDLDLILSDANGSILDASTGTEGTESVSGTTGAGGVYILVHKFSGVGEYHMQVEVTGG